ncbi:AMP-binding protein [Candidatus Gracilibacteria bacterium]|nr:AMP-binding protein [Candidatus Gracilibacteria bacterium]
MIVDMFADKLPQVLRETTIEHVVLVRLTDLMPALPGLIAYSVIKYWNRMVPPCTVPTTALRVALAHGATLQQERKLQVAAYTAQVEHETLAVLQYTGGTTGVSKGAMLSHGNLLANVAQLDAFVQGHIAHGKECVLAVLPLYHIFAFTVNMLYFLCGGGAQHPGRQPAPARQPSTRDRKLPDLVDSWREHAV